LGKTPRFLQGPGTSRPELDRIRAAMQEWQPIRSELVNYTKDGEPFWLELDLVPVADDKGWYRHWVGIERDITERKLAVDALQASAERYQLLFDANPLPMWVFDRETLAFLAVNEAAIRKYGYTREEFLAMNIRDIRPPEDVAALEQSVATGAQGPQSSGIWRHRAKDGRILRVDISTHGIVFDGRPARIVLPLDVTDRLALEEQLLQAQKMETIGRLAGGIAHDFNNLLTVINGYAELLLQRTGEDARGMHIFGQILKAGERAAKLTAQLLAFSRKQVLQPKAVSVNALIDSMRPILERLIREDIEIVWSLDEALGIVHIDPSQFEQVILNLAVNARDAMPNGGWLTIETANLTVEAEYSQRHPDVAPGRYVLVSVTDTGHGMPPEVMRHIFDPFFTTKEQGVGTGLGLATVYGVVKQSGGHLTVYSEPGVGSRFKVYLPRVEAAVTETKEEIMPFHNLQGHETILLVEDDADLREYASGILRDLGYQVIEAGNGPDAIVAAERHPGEIHLLLTDVVMPKLSGRDLAELICGRRPAIKVLFMSGYTENAIVHQGVLEQGLNFMAKPFSPSELGKKIKAALLAPRRAKAVLILDDDEGIRDFLNAALNEAGYETMVCANGPEAIQQLRQRPIDLLITDLVMPGQEGIETITLARKEFPHLKVLAVSGYGSGDYLKLARALGANETLAKPLDLARLCGTVKSMIGE
jgi:two-component system cell cycle sensor histidine kinase/response regulator CckA